MKFEFSVRGSRPISNSACLNLALVALLFGAACSSVSPPAFDDGQTDGSSSSGGTASEGDASTGGNASGGDNVGGRGSSSTGGKSSSGGNSSTGGATSSGGTNGEGGNPGSGGVGGDGSGTTGGSAYRPFSADSPWNTKIGENPNIDPDSEELISDLASSSVYGSQFSINMNQYSIPLYFADENTPHYQVLADIGGIGWTGDNGMNATASVPIPDGAGPDPLTDGHMLIVDLSAHTEYGFFQARKEGDNWRCTLCANIDLLGTGVRPIKEGNTEWYTSHGPRACGFPLIAGLIRTASIEAGVIDHALVIAYPHIRAGLYTPPASTGQARMGDQAIKSRGIPCGGRVQLDPNLDLDSLGLSRTGRIIARALQKYGAYVGDYSDSISLYAENAPAAREYWASGVLTGNELHDKVLPSSLRVIELGTLYDDHNGD